MKQIIDKQINSILDDIDQDRENTNLEIMDILINGKRYIFEIT